MQLESEVYQQYKMLLAFHQAALKGINSYHLRGKKRPQTDWNGGFSDSERCFPGVIVITA